MKPGGTSAVFRGGGDEDCQRGLSGEHTKSELEDCLRVRCTLDPLVASGCGRCLPQLCEKQTPGKQRSWTHAVGISLTELS